jgi:hypothetical protein
MNVINFPGAVPTRDAFSPNVIGTAHKDRDPRLGLGVVCHIQLIFAVLSVHDGLSILTGVVSFPNVENYSFFLGLPVQADQFIYASPFERCWGLSSHFGGTS